MKEWRTSAYYIVNADMLFLVLNVNTGALSFSTCPHRATLFTRRESADELLDQINKYGADLNKFVVLPTATHDPRVVVG